MGKATYVLTANFFRHMIFKDGKMVESTRYVKGDRIELTDEEAPRLVDAEAVMPEDEFNEREAARDTEQAAGAESAPEPAEGQDGTEAIQDEYSAMEYSDLQAAAKARDLSAGGSKAELRARLREFHATA